MSLEREKIVELIEKNLYKVKVGDTFLKQTKLYSVLGIPLNKQDGNKTIKAVVSLYIKWERTGKLNRRERLTNEIRVIEINESPEYGDARANNGGAHNNKYGPIIKPALLQYSYNEFTTYREIDEKIFNFKKQDVTVSSRYDNKHTREYKDKLYDYLKKITETALDGLKKENLLKYKKVFVISGDIGIFKACNFRIDNNMLFSDLIYKISEWQRQAQKEILDVDLFEIIMNKFQRGTKEYISMDGLTVFEFLDKARKPNSVIDIKKLTQFYEKSFKIAPRTATEDEEKFIENLEEDICNHLGFTREEININSKKRNRLYSHTDILYKLLGWKGVWKALQVNVLDRAAGIEKYPLSDFSQEVFFKTLEPYMIKWTVKKIVNTYEIEKKKRSSPKYKIFGKNSGVIVGRDEDYPYLAKDKAVNKLHCQVFHHTIDEEFFEQYIEQEQVEKDASDIAK